MAWCVAVLPEVLGEGHVEAWRALVVKIHADVHVGRWKVGQGSEEVCLLPIETSRAYLIEEHVLSIVVISPEALDSAVAVSSARIVRGELLRLRPVRQQEWKQLGVLHRGEAIEEARHARGLAHAAKHEERRGEQESGDWTQASHPPNASMSGHSHRAIPSTRSRYHAWCRACTVSGTGGRVADRA